MATHAQAIAELIWKDRERILDFAASLKGTDAVIECRLRGASMEPAIPRGARLRIAIGSTAALRVGEVVAFVRDDGVCVHRLAHRARDGEHLLTQGDACLYPDAPVPVRCVLGPVSEFRLDERWIPAGDCPADARSRSRAGRALLGLVAALLAVDARLARAAARVLRSRKETAASAQP